ncbi:MAG: cysteine--tRNA ligase [Deltaproteobacteria bacterium]|nr:cysteine--tRNA ligase [Deltaproteobacteria bacterium]
MNIKLYNTATRQKEEFIPLVKGKVGIYVCGVTVYDHSHIGHARSAIVFDVLVRYFMARGMDVTYIRNFTDVDDKIINRANELGKDPAALAQEYIDSFYEDMDALGVMRPNKEPRATEYIDGMIAMIRVLIDKGFAYEADGDVFYAVEKLDDYGRLSGRRLEDMKAGSRIDINEKKRHPMDFTLWKPSKPGEPMWDSPWGKGRPGWHMECSVMSNHYLGATFDIHGGGMDLLFPHHENERAQSKAATGGEFARYWVHNGFLTVESEKMSKSLGNFIFIKDALREYHPEVLRFFLLSKQYRSPLDFSKKDVLDFQAGLIRIYRTLQRIEELTGEKNKKDFDNINGLLAGDQQDEFLNKFTGLMDDDLNTAGAIGIIFDKTKELNRMMDDAGNDPPASIKDRLKEERLALLKAANVLGILTSDPSEFIFQIEKPADIDESEIEDLIGQRNEARARKDWPKADEIRDKLKELGIVLEDKAGVTKWRKEV